MAGQIQSVFAKVLVTISSVVYDVSDSIESINFRMAGNTNSELTVRFTTPALPSGIVPNLGNLINIEIWSSFAPTAIFRSGNTWITECVTDGYYFDLRSVPFDVTKLVIPGDGVTPTTLSNNTLRNLVDLTKTALAIPATGVSADAVNVYIGTSTSGSGTTVTATIDRPYLEALYEWSTKFGYLTYCWRNAIYCVDFVEDYAATAPTTFAFNACLDARVSFNNVSDVKVFSKIYRLPLATANYTIPWVRFGKILDMSSENHYYNTKAGTRRSYGLALQYAGNAQAMSITIPGYTEDNLRPGKRVDLGAGFFSRVQGAYILNEVIHNFSARDGWKINLRGIKAYTF